MQLLFDYPWYFILLCLVAGGAYSFALYRSDRRKSPSATGKVLWLLAVLRFLTVSVIAFLLMAPMVKRKVNLHEKPIVVVAQDVSESTKGFLPDDALSSLLGMKDYEMAIDSFGGKSTDIAAALATVADRYAGRNLGAVVLVTDGIYNQGQNPSIAVSSLPVPVYTVALGDTTHHAGSTISNIRYNHTAYLGSQFPLEVTVNATLLKGKKETLTVTHKGRTLFSKEINYTDNTFSTTLPLTIDADKPGLQNYTLRLGQASPRTIAVEVIDGHQKIAIVGAAPHPDMGTLKQSIERNPHYEVSTFFADDNPNLKDFSLLVLHNLPNGQNSKKWPAMPTIHVIGSQTDLGRFNAQHTGMEIIAKAHKTDEVTAAHNNGFSLFSLDEDVCRRLEQMPPLTAPFGNYHPAANLQSLFSAKIGGTDSGRPLIAFCQQDGIRHAFIVGEGIWRWHLQDFLMTGSHEDFDQLIEKMVVYTSLQTNKERFHVTTQHIYNESEEVVIEAELYNDNFEPVNTPDVQCLIRKSDTLAKGKASEYTFNRSGSRYMLNVGTLQPGQYSYSAQTTLSGKKYTASGSFVVENTHLEQANMVADHALLNTLSQTTGGKMFYPAQIKELEKALAQSDNLKTVVYSQTRYTELLDLPLLFLLLILLLAAEWIIRKWDTSEL